MTHAALTRQIALAMLAGAALGAFTFHVVPAPGSSLLAAAWHDYVQHGLIAIVAGLFVALLKMLVVPLVFITLVNGVLQSGADLRRFGRLGATTFGLYLFTTAIAVALALLVGTLLAPGAGVTLGDANFSAPPPPGFVEVITSLVPANPVQAFAQGNLLQVIVFSLLLGIAIVHAGPRAESITGLFAQANGVVLELVALVMRLAPLGVFALLAKMFGERGLDIFAGLAWYVMALLLALALQVLLVYLPMLRLLAGVAPRLFLVRFREPALLAFSTASSAATLPVTLRTVEHRLGVPNGIASFTLPLGATVNMDGTAIMQGVATCFIAQAYGVDLSAFDYAAVIAMATLASIGTAAVPSAGLVTLTLVLAEVGLPFEAIGLILGVDRFLDMARTTVNVTGDAVVSLIVARREGVLRIPDEDEPVA